MPSFLTPASIAAFHRALHRWYAAHGRRDLPWRNTRDPYRIYLSEVMLQQTQVKTVLERYYEPFLHTFPTLAALAATDTEAVAKAWEGLGYYRRAAHLHKAAQVSNGALPETVEELLALPGIGRNTAHAVACFAFGKAVPVMEANLRRVLCRIFALEQAEEAALWQKAEQLLDKRNAFDYNQAMMDLGALVCTKRNPRCVSCPASTVCRGKTEPERYPAPKAVKAVPVRKRVIIAFHDGKGRYYLGRRETRFLNGLYGFPEYGESEGPFTLGGKEYERKKAALIGHITQTYSHFTLEADVYVLHATPGLIPANMQCISLEGMKKLPLSRADHKVMKMLEEGIQALK